MYKDKVIDPAGYSHDHTIIKGIKGKTAEEVYATAIKIGMVTTLEYAAYVGAELKKAEYALRYNLDYTQE